MNALPKRKSLRLPEYDYSTPGAYFVTFCTYKRKNTLSRIVGAIHESPDVILTGYGDIVKKVIMHLPPHLHAEIDQYVIMPNHVHMIVMLSETEALRAIHESPLRSRSVISKVVGYIKMNVSKEIHNLFGVTDIWQRGYYDHVIRGQEDYQEIAEYIINNPKQWELDKLYSEQ